jgi:hypothetical protein
VGGGRKLIYVRGSFFYFIFYFLVTVTGSHSKCFGSGSAFGLDPYSIRPVDPDPDSDSRSRSKWAEGFSCSLDVLYGGLGISKLQFLIRICTGIQPKMLVPDPDSMNPDPKQRYSTGFGCKNFP